MRFTCPHIRDFLSFFLYIIDRVLGIILEYVRFWHQGVLSFFHSPFQGVGIRGLIYISPRGRAPIPSHVEVRYLTLLSTCHPGIDSRASAATQLPRPVGPFSCRSLGKTCAHHPYKLTGADNAFFYAHCNKLFPSSFTVTLVRYRLENHGHSNSPLIRAHRRRISLGH